MTSLEVSFYVGKRLSINIFYILTFHLKTCQWMKGNAMPFFCLLGTYSIGQTKKRIRNVAGFFLQFYHRYTQHFDYILTDFNPFCTNPRHREQN